MGAIEPRILTWARTTAGLSLEDAVRALRLGGAREKTGVQRLESMELGEEEPSRPLIGRMARVYRRPLVVFYLAEPPRRGDRGQDFRTLPGQDKYNPEIDALVRDIKARQGLIRSMLDDGQTEGVDFIGSATMEVPAPAMAAQIAERLQFDLGRYRAATNHVEAFAYLRDTIEANGVYLLLLGNLGSFHTNIPADVFRGFALADRIAPLIVINDQDARTAWPFTAVHELTHLWLGQTGISGTDTEKQVERYCNNVAGEFLLPARELKELGPALRLSVASVAEEIRAFAEARHVSRPMVAYKLYRTGMIGKAAWAALDDRFRKEWEEYKEREAERSRRAEGGPSYYVVRRHRMGGALLRLVRRSLDEGTITYTKAGLVLGVKPRNVEPLLSMRGAR